MRERKIHVFEHELKFSNSEVCACVRVWRERETSRTWAYDDERIDDFSFGFVAGLGQALAT